MRARQQTQRQACVGHDDLCQRIGYRMIDDGADRAFFPRLGQEFMGIEPLPPQRDQQIAGAECSRIGDDSRDRGIRPFERRTEPRSNGAQPLAHAVFPFARHSAVAMSISLNGWRTPSIS